MTHLLDPTALVDPSEALEELLTGPSVLFDARLGAWLVVGAKAGNQALRASALSARATPAFMRQLDAIDRAELGALEDHFDRWLVFSDGPAHSILRGIVRPWYDPGEVESRTARVTQIVDLASSATPSGVDFDVSSDFAYPVSVAVAVLTLDVGDDLDDLLVIAKDLIDFIATPSPDMARGRRALIALDRLEGLVETRWATGSNAYARCRAAGVAHADALAVVSQLLTGTVEPLAAAIASAAVLVDGRSADRGAESVDRFVEEALRLDPPFRLAPRMSTAAVTIDGVTIPSGERVLILLHAANRDGADLDDASTAGQRRRHLAFGAGSHYCLGAGDARQVVALSTSELLRRSLRLTAAPVRQPNFGSVAWDVVPGRFDTD